MKWHPSLLKHMVASRHEQLSLFATILFCFLADAYLFYSHGLLRAYENNAAYLEFFQNFPEILSKPGIEPLFILISYYLSQGIHSDIWSLIILKNTTLLLQLWLFYKITRVFLQKHSLSLLAVAFLNFSFAYFSLTDNLLRNHFANLLLLIALHSILQILIQKKTRKREIVLAILCGALLIYTHILPTLLLDFSLLLLILFIGSLLLLQKMRHFSLLQLPSTISWSVLKSLFLIATLIFFLQLPYIIRLAQANANVGDYKIETTNAPTSEVTPTTPENNLAILDSLVHSPSNLFRILFEFRLPGLSVSFMLLVAVGLLMSLFKRPLDPPRLLLFLFWLLAYCGSKLDLLFGIGTLPYRFSLMLIFPSVIFLLISIQYLTSKIQHSSGKTFLSLTFLILFLGINIPLTTETTLLRTYEKNPPQQALLKKVFEENIHQTESVFLINGLDFSAFSPHSHFLRNETAFSVDDPEKLRLLMEDNQIQYIIFDHSKIAEKGSSLGTSLNTNLSAYQHSPYFENLGEFIGPNFHITLFQFSETPIQKSTPEKVILECGDEKTCVQKLHLLLNKQHSPLVAWNREIEDTQTPLIREFLRFKNETLLEIRYTSIYSLTDFFSHTSFIQFYNFALPYDQPPQLTLSIESALIPLSIQHLSRAHAHLEQSSVNRLIITGELQGQTLSYATLTRNGFRVFVALIALSGIILLYAFLSFWEKKYHGQKSIFVFSSIRDKRLILFFLFLSISDMLILQFAVIEIYKYLFQI